MPVEGYAQYAVLAVEVSKDKAMVKVAEKFLGSLSLDTVQLS